MGWMSLPLSFLHLLQMKGNGIIPVGGRPWLLLYQLGYWMLMITLQVLYIKSRAKNSLIVFIIIAILSAPYSAYYFSALMGI